MKSRLLHFVFIGVSVLFGPTPLRSQQVLDRLSFPDSASYAAFRTARQNKDIIVEYELTPQGDTLFHYKRKPFDFGPFSNKPIQSFNTLQPSDTAIHTDTQKALTASANSLSSVDMSKAVGQIPFTDGVTPTGGKTYSIPIVTATNSSSVPQIAFAYNSQAGNGIAGYGWNISGVSAISVGGKSIYYDGITSAVDLATPDECTFALDGVRLINNTGGPSEFQYETAQGFILVQKHLSGKNIAYFTVAYPNGSRAIFGFTNNTSTKPIYPITEFTDIKGYKIYYEYETSGNTCFLSRISYGGKTSTDYQAEILFNYQDRTDFTTAYISGLPIALNKLLYQIVSKSMVNGTMQELCTYALTHELKDYNRLVKIDCSTGTSSLNPLVFEYEGPNQTENLIKDIGMPLTEYFRYSANPIFIRGKMQQNEYGDGLIVYPGIFSTYTHIGDKVKTFLGKEVARYPVFGSEYPENQEFLVFPNLEYGYLHQTILAGKGFQTIEAVDINGDGVDEIVKVNFGELSGNSTTLTITTYKEANGTFSPQSFNVLVNGLVTVGEASSPMSRHYLFGDFKGTGKVQLLTISHNKTITNEDKASYFALIDLDAKTKISETTLFPFSPDDQSDVLPLDVDGDGKMELCHFTASGMDIYRLVNASFTKQDSTTTINNNATKGGMVLGDLNGDGKVDVLVPPTNSYEDFKDVFLPVWAPHYCPRCQIQEPITELNSNICRGCGLNLRDFYFRNQNLAKCRKCASPLSTKASDPVQFGKKMKTVDAVSFRDLYCPIHGTSVLDHSDLVYVDKGQLWTAYLSTGHGFVSASMPICTKEAGDQSLLMDINNDGNADLLFINKKQAYLYLNQQGTIQSIQSDPFSTILMSDTTKILPANICDLYHMSHFITIEGGKVIQYRFTGNHIENQLLTSLTDSYGNKYHHEYFNIIENNYHYNPSNTAPSYPYAPWKAPLYLLNTSYALTENLTYLYNESYTYEGAVIHRTGLGFAGFEKIVTTDQINHTTTEETHDPQLFGVTTRVDSPERTVEYTYAQDDFPNRKNNPRPTYIYELNKLTNVSTAKYIDYDVYKNPSKTTTHTGSPALAVVTSYKYHNEITPACYLTGLPIEFSKTTLRNGATWSVKDITAYNINHLPASKITYVENNKVNETRWTYDSNGNVTSELSAPYDVTTFLGTTYTYDAAGRYLTASTNALGQTTTYAGYDKFGHAGTVTDFKNRSTTYLYDAWGRLRSTLYPDATTESVQTEWGGPGLYTVTGTATGKPATVVHYDALGREIRKGNQRFDAQWQFVDQTYDERGRLEKVSLPFRGTSPNFWAAYTYDQYNRPLTLTEASGKTTTWTYNGLSTTETKNGIATTKTTDASGALVKVDDPGGTIEYTLRPDGQPSSITAPGNVVTTFTYDAYGRKASVSDPSAGTQTYSENNASDGTRTQTVTDANSKTVTTISDKYGRVTNVNRPEFNTAYAYNADGLLTGETSTNGTSTVFTYDSFDRVATSLKRVPDGKYLQKAFTYAEGAVSGIQYASQSATIGTENFVYANGHNTEIKLNNTTSIWKLTEENALGQPTKAVTGALNRTYGYTDFGMPTGRTAGNIQNFAYDFDVQTGNLKSRRDNAHGFTETFGYDNLNRLSQQDIPYVGKQAVVYSSNGNITQMPEVGSLAYENIAKPYQVTELSSIGFPVLIKDQQVTYTSFQRPDSITQNDTSASFVYDAEGDRVKMNIAKGATPLLTRYYIDNQYEIDAQQNMERLYLGGDVYSAPAVYVKENNVWKIYYICRDYLGSITHVINTTGTLKQELSYDAWGRLRDPSTHLLDDPSWEPQLFLGRGYTGHEHLVQFGLINMNARLYDPALGRFLSPDPYVQMPDFTQNFNRYSYCLNNPLAYKDADGEFFLWTAFNAFTDVIGNLFTHGFAFKHYDFRRTVNSFNIDLGMFKGNFGQILSRFYWEWPQTFIGKNISQVQNTLFAVKSVSSYGGATVVETYEQHWGAFTLGSYIYGSRGIEAKPDNYLFQHEYGHYLQSQASGLFYLQRYAVPSLVDAASGSIHKFHPVEQDANIRAYQYFMKHVPGFNMMDKDKGFEHGHWYKNYNPINGYDWSLGFDNPANQRALKKGLVRPAWWDFLFTPSVYPFIIDVLDLKQ